jgi:hypothetical protein
MHQVAYELLYKQIVYTFVATCATCATCPIELTPYKYHELQMSPTIQKPWIFLIVFWHY